MKLLTLNTHSLLEAQGPEKLRRLADFLLAHRPDVTALQEVNQRCGAPPVAPEGLPGYAPAQACIPVRKGNYAAELTALLTAGGAEVSWTYLPVKRGWGCFDEGLAIVAMKERIRRVESCRISRCRDYEDWRTRRALAVQLESGPDWFCCVHMGWWDDAVEPFLPQWQALERFLAPKGQDGAVWLMGDFNAPAHRRGESYDCIVSRGWHDASAEADERLGEATIPGRIDGWEDLRQGARIDQVWCSGPGRAASCRVVLAEEPVSDHYGVLVQTRD